MKKIGPCRRLKKINDNAYRIDLPSSILTCSTFNIQDLIAYQGEDGGNFGPIFFSTGEDDAVRDDAKDDVV